MFGFVYAYRYFSRIVFVARNRAARVYIHFVGVIYRVGERYEVVDAVYAGVERVVVYLKIEIFVGYGLVLDRFVIIGYVESYGGGRVARGINRVKRRVKEF